MFGHLKRRRIVGFMVAVRKCLFQGTSQYITLAWCILRYLWPSQICKIHSLGSEHKTVQLTAGFARAVLNFARVCRTVCVAKIDKSCFAPPQHPGCPGAGLIRPYTVIAGTLCIASGLYYFASNLPTLGLSNMRLIKLAYCWDVQ
jgi:hypothetical protein